MPDVSRRELLKSLGGLGASALLAGPLLSACGSAATPTTVASPMATSFGYLPITDATPILVAHAAGLMAEHGLDVARPARYRAWPELSLALQRGLVDFTHLLLPLAMHLRLDSGIPLKVLASTHVGGSALTVGHHISEIGDLGGGVVAIPNWFSIHNVLVQAVLREAGLDAHVDDHLEPGDVDPDHVHMVVMPPADMAPALKDNIIDGFIVAEPYNARAELDGSGRVLRFTGDMWRDHGCCVLVAPEHLIDDDPALVQAVVDVVVAGQLATRSDILGAARLLTNPQNPYLDDSFETVYRALNWYDPSEYADAITHPEWGSKRIDFLPFPYPSLTERLAEEMRRTAIGSTESILEGVALSAVHGELIDDRFVRSALERLDPDNTFGLPTSLTRIEEISL